MILIRGSLFLVVSAAFVIALAGNPGVLPAGASPQAGAAAQQSGTTMQDCLACHDEAMTPFATNPHMALEKSPHAKVANPCESCHGPGKAHIDAGGDRTLMVTFIDKNFKVYNDKCLACHKKNHEITGYKASKHARQSLSCSDCHNIHRSAPMTRLLPQRASNLCISCHTEQKTDFSKPFHHRVREGAMECNDCHEPHSGIDRRMNRSSFSGQEMCVRCHTEKQGPFVFEHAAVRIRGCEGCHEPHGSNNPKMLVRSTMTALCLECHSRTPVTRSILTSQPPSFHNVNSPTYQNCTSCHLMIHGSNFNRAFLR